MLAGWVAEGRADWLEVSDGFEPSVSTELARDEPADTTQHPLRHWAAVEFGPGCALPLEERRTLFLLAGLEGTGRVGSEAVLAVSSHLLEARLPEDLSVVAIPFGFAGRDGREAAPGEEPVNGGRFADDDGDGVVDEDGPDDLDGDGYVLEMLVEHPDGEWARDEASRLVRLARKTDAVRLIRVAEGHDDDADGLYNEDGETKPGAESSFPIGWSAPTNGRGKLPMADPRVRQLADLIYERRTVGVVTLQGSHGGLARPGGFREVPWRSSDDALSFDRLAEAFADDTGCLLYTSPSPRDS